ncbi:MAG: RNA methyltransferase [Clostridia bacterium]|nr:RNA methyltransferase [Clostridia bacterium]
MEERITSKQNTSLSHVRKLLSSRAYRNECREFVADGIKLLQEALKWKFDVKSVILSDGVIVPDLPAHIRVLRVSPELMKYVSNMQSPQGALFTCAYPQADESELSGGTLVLDEIQDPGNVGTILRTADAMNVPVVLCGGCADPFNEKTVRASMGAIFRTKLRFSSAEDVIAACRHRHIPLAVTALHADSKDIRDAELRKCAVVIGSEGHGVSPLFLENADLRLIIPMSPRCESLNAAVAASIVLWQMQRIDA